MSSPPECVKTHPQHIPEFKKIYRGETPDPHLKGSAATWREGDVEGREGMEEGMDLKEGREKGREKGRKERERGRKPQGLSTQATPLAQSDNIHVDQSHEWLK